jgi:hypothetical protein
MLVVMKHGASEAEVQAVVEEKAGLVVFVEAKSRSGPSFGHSLEKAPCDLHCHQRLDRVERLSGAILSIRRRFGTADYRWGR